MAKGNEFIIRKEEFNEDAMEEIFITGFKKIQHASKSGEPTH